MFIGKSGRAGSIECHDQHWIVFVCLCLYLYLYLCLCIFVFVFVSSARCSLGRVAGLAAELGVKNDTTNIGLEANHQTDESTLTGALTLITFCLREGEEGGRGIPVTRVSYIG